MMTVDGSRRLTVGPLELRHGADVFRVETRVGAKALWFESRDGPLALVPEAFGSALLLAAAARGQVLHFTCPPCPVWLRNSNHALAVARGWWGYPLELPQIENSPQQYVAAPSRPEQTALCFGGGVDSFHALLRGGDAIGSLLYVHGFDVPLADRARAAAAERSLRAVAAAGGIRAVALRTNLREHPACRRANWEHIHGGALAAAGHLLAPRINQLLIAASFPFAFDRPWGSHWKLDPWWSSARVSVRHVGAERWRTQKLAELAEETLVRQHLRGCWEHRGPAGNCGRCEKCLRTMLILEGLGKLDVFKVFPSSRQLSATLDATPRIRAQLLPVYQGFLGYDLGTATRAALERLLARSQVPEPSIRHPRWWRRLHG